MPIVMNMTWEGVTRAQYDQLHGVVNWEGDKPKGAMFHVAAFSPQGIRVTDVWSSAEDFNHFLEQRLLPGVQKVGIQGGPKVEILPTHAVFAPAYKPL
ncbi:MAG TPA: hypothetical protein VGI10_08170 [Polyangiaceae bacterium]|jgi:hypothetical protein